MDKIEVIKFLTEEIDKENIKITTYKEEYKKAFEQDNLTWEWYQTHPEGSKTKIKEYLKIIRRLTLEYEKEMR